MSPAPRPASGTPKVRHREVKQRPKNNQQIRSRADLGLPCLITKLGFSVVGGFKEESIGSACCRRRQHLGAAFWLCHLRKKELSTEMRAWHALRQLISNFIVGFGVPFHY